MSAPDTLFDLGDREAVLRALARTARGVRRRWVSIAWIALVFVIAGTLAAIFVPRTYSTASRVLVRKNYVMPALAHPKRAVPIGADSLTQSATELVEDRDALQTLIDRYDLLTRWDAERPTVLRLKDQLVTAVFGPAPDTDRTEALMEVLASRIHVTVDDEVVRVWAQWTDPQTAVDIVEGSVDAYLEARRKVDVQAIADTHTILEQSAETARLEVERHLATVELMTATSDVVMPAVNRTRGSVDLVGRSTVDPLRQARLDVLAAQKQVATLEEEHDTRVRALEAALADRLTRETERHPDVVEMKRQLADLRKTPETVIAAQRSVQALTSAYVSAGGAVDDLRDDAPMAVAVPHTAPAAIPVKDEPSDALLYARSMLESSIEVYEDLLDRLKNTGIELDTAKAGFDYRYNLLEPARLPKKPDAPNAALMVIGALLAGLGAGTMRAAWAEWRQ